MKKLLFLSIALISFSISYSAKFPDYRGVVNDYEDVLNDKQEKSLTKIIEKNEALHQVKIIVVSTKSFNPASDYRKYIFGLFEHWKMTASKSKNGILILVSLEKKELKIIPGSEMKLIFDKSKISNIVQDIMTPKFLKEKHYAGLKKGIKSMIKSIKTYKKAGI